MVSGNEILKLTLMFKKKYIYIYSHDRDEVIGANSSSTICKEPANCFM